MHPKQADGKAKVSAQFGSTFQNPYLSDVGIIALVPEAWHGSIWMPRHQVLSRLARYFRVIWANPALEWRPQWIHRTIPKSGTVRSIEAVGAGLTIYNPGKWFPRIYRPNWLARFTEQQRLRQMQGILQQQGCNKLILYLWRPQYASALSFVDPDISCYHIDDEYTFSTVEQSIDKQEAQLISHVDQVFIHSPSLLEKKGNLNPNTAFIPNGVDYDAYSESVGEPEDLKEISHPRIGYVGVIKSQLNLSLLVTLAKRHRDWSFVLVGPQGHLQGKTKIIVTLAKMSNVHFLGPKPVPALPAYTQHLDVCLMCYEINDYTDYIYPLKLHEYLASGRPIVGSPIRSLQDFGHLIQLARTADEWSEALTNALSPNECSISKVKARQEAARAHDWERLVQRIAEVLCERLGQDYLKRFETLDNV